MTTKTCPTCAASVEIEQDAGTCAHCGTECHVRARAGVGAQEIPAPVEIPAAPTDDDPDRWRFEEWVGALLREDDPERRVAIARAMPAFGEEALVWAPAIADLMIDADENLDRALGTALGKLAGTWKSTALSGQVLRVVRARLPRLPHSEGVVTALAGVGLGGLKSLVELADQADERGDDQRVSRVLAPIWEIVERQTDTVAAACLEILFRLLPEAGPATRHFIIHYLADCIDGRYEVPLPGPREWHEFEVLIPMTVRFIDDTVEHDPQLVAELCQEIQRLHTYHSKSLRDSRAWHQAVRTARTDAGRVIVKQLVAGLYPPDSTFALADGEVPPATDPDVQGEVVGEVIDSRVRCPACGAPLPTRGSEPVVACARCARPVRIPAGIRTALEGRSFEEELEHWSESELVRALREEADAGRRRQISAEIDSARTHGARYVPQVDELVAHMIEERDERVLIDLADALGRMVRTGGPDFHAELLDAVGRHPPAGLPPRLFEPLGLCGAPAFELLIAIGRASFAELSADPEAAARGAMAFSAVSTIVTAAEYEPALIRQLLALVLEMPQTPDEAGAWYVGEEAAQVVAQVFVPDDDHAEHERRRQLRRDEVLSFLDEHIDPGGTTYSGMAPQPGCALFYALGGPPGLGRLVGFIESLWESPVDAADLAWRLAALSRAVTDEVKLLVLCSIRERPQGLSPADLAQAQAVLSPLAEIEPLASAATTALAVLQGEDADPQENDDVRTARSSGLGTVWYLVKLRWRTWLARIRG